MDIFSEIVGFADANPEYKTWRGFPGELSDRIAKTDPETVLALAFKLWARGEQRFLWAACAAVRYHPAAFKLVRWRELERMLESANSWGAVDTFALLGGTAWRKGQITDKRIFRWARSSNRWWRRAALVCTVLLNRKSLGGRGDPERTLAVCRLLVDDRDDMVVKGMSWALRELVGPYSNEVRGFLSEHEGALAARVRREVRNKLETGLKNPRRGVRRPKAGA